MKKHKTLLITIGAILLFIITILTTNLILNLTDKQDVQIPNLVGKEQTQAKSEAIQSSLKFVIGGEKYSKDVPAGCIISQDPQYLENYTVKEGTTITVVLSKGRNLVEVPKVIGLKSDEAVTTLEELGLLVNVTEEYNKKVEAGYVIEQSAEAKTQVDAGEIISITVSKGIEKVTVPDLLGKTLDEAKGIITENGLKLKQIYTYVDESQADGVVLEQDIDPNTEVEKDSYINITINSLPIEKTGRIIVNVKSLLERKGKATTNEDGTEKMVTVKVLVDGKNVLTQEVVATVSSLEAKFTAKGWIDIDVLIDDVRYTEDYYGEDLEQIKDAEIAITIN